MRHLLFFIATAIFCTAQAQTSLPDFLRTNSLAPTPEASSWALMESETAWLISQHNAHKRADPASLTKLMTAYLTFDALNQGKINAEDQAYISKKAWKAPGSRMFLEVDNSVSIGELIHGLIIQSGNDAAIALAEHLGGTESGFAQMMNEQAKRIGMKNTHYINASGLPAKEHYTSAYDTALLSRALIQSFPDLYGLFSIQEYTYNDITQPNRNKLLWREGNYDGLKTGHTKAAGYCLAGTSKRENTRFIAVVMGADSVKSREQSVQALIEYGFAQYETVAVMGPDTQVQQRPLYKGTQEAAQLSSPSQVSILLPRGQAANLRVEYALPENIVAPLTTATAIGQANLFYADNPLGSVAIHPLQDYALGPIWVQLIDAVKLKIF